MDIQLLLDSLSAMRADVRRAIEKRRVHAEQL
jgi:hypothetical protein